ncbi:MAG: DUF3025 domain-containing protein, partial [Variovorax sp.]
MSFAGIDWTRPWLAPWRAPGEALAQASGRSATAAALQRATPPTVLRFVPQDRLPPGEAYEAFI